MNLIPQTVSKVLVCLCYNNTKIIWNHIPNQFDITNNIERQTKDVLKTHCYSTQHMVKIFVVYLGCLLFDSKYLFNVILKVLVNISLSVCLTVMGMAVHYHNHPPHTVKIYEVQPHFPLQ